MSPVFTINFRRETYLRALAHSRRRLIQLGIWVSYFGLLGVVLGLYGLNCAALHRREALVQRQLARFRAAQNTPNEWTVDAAQLGAVETYYVNPRQWRDRLARLTALLPTNVQVVSLAVNPDNLGSAPEQNKLVITGQYRATAGGDRMSGVVQLVSTLHGDSVFASSYRNIRLASSRTSGPLTDFVIECN